MTDPSTVPSAVPFAAAVLAVVVLATVAGAAAGPGPDPCEVVRRAGRRMGRLGYQLRFTVALAAGSPPSAVWEETGSTTVAAGDFEMDFTHRRPTGDASSYRLRSVAGRTFLRDGDAWELPGDGGPAPSWDPVLVSRWLANAVAAEDLGAAQVPQLGRLPLRRLSFRPSTGSFPGDPSAEVVMDAYLDPHGRVRWVSVAATWAAPSPASTTLGLEVVEGDGHRRIRVPASMLEIAADGTEVFVAPPAPDPGPDGVAARPDFVPADGTTRPDFVPAEPSPTGAVAEVLRHLHGEDPGAFAPPTVEG